MAKGLVIVAVAFMLDMVQGLIMLAFTGTVTIIGGLLQFIPGVGTLAGAGVSAAGIVTGEAIDVALSFGFGSFLVMLLILNDSFYWGAFVGTSFIEIVLPFLPGWTVLALRSVYNKYQEDKASQTTQ